MLTQTTAPEYRTTSTLASELAAVVRTVPGVGIIYPVDAGRHATVHVTISSIG